MSADQFAVTVESGVGAHEQIRMRQISEQSAFHPFDSTLFVKFEHIHRICISSEVGKLFVCMEMVVPENDVIQLVLLDDSFQPVEIIREVFTF